MTADSGALPALHSAHVSGTFWARSCGSAWPTASPPQITFKVIVLFNISLTSASKIVATVTPEIIIFYHSLFWDVFTPSSPWLQPFLWRIVLHKSAGGILNQPHHGECVFVCVCVTDYYKESRGKPRQTAPLSGQLWNTKHKHSVIV